MHQALKLTGLVAKRGMDLEQLGSGSLFQHMALGLLLENSSEVLAAQTDGPLEPRLNRLLMLACAEQAPTPQQLEAFVRAVQMLRTICDGCFLPEEKAARWAGGLAEARAGNFVVAPEAWESRRDRALPTADSAAGEGSEGLVLPADISPDAAMEDLPISAFRQQILDHVLNNQLTIIQADTGAGKSTRVPQFLFRELGDSCNIYVTQPRRMAATSLAKRVASELGETVGNAVGYKIGNDIKGGRDTRITFVTSGWLLHRLISDPTLAE
jgi:hypothetical protein